MKPEWWRRLSKVEGSMATDKNGIVFYPLKAESDEEYDARIARWKRGETVEGMDSVYTGKEPFIGIVKYVAAKKRHE